MNCAQAHRLISPSLDGELTAAEQAALAAHLRICPSCRLTESGLRAQQQLFAREPRLAAPVAFRSRVLANLDSAPVAAPGWLRLLVGIGEVLVLALIILAGMVSGDILAGRINPSPAVASALALDLFEPAPPSSLGGTYLAMTEVDDER